MEPAKIVPLGISDHAQSPTPATTFPFLLLKPEFRLNIYRLLYRRKTQIWLTRYLAHHGGPDRIETGLLLSCRQIYNEASAVLYDMNTFAVNGRAGSREILERLGTQACSHLKKLRIWSIPLEFRSLERQQVYHTGPFPSLPIYRSIWDCVSYHLHKLETIELGTFRIDFFQAISRCTSSIRLVDKRPPLTPPTIEIEVWENLLASSLDATRPLRARGPFRGLSWRRHNCIWLPAIKSMRLVGRLSPSDCEFLQQHAYQHYEVYSVRRLYATDLCTAYGVESTVLITLRMRPQSLHYAIVSTEEDNLRRDISWGSYQSG